ncbi:MarR family transcriptional regulator [Alphaproteobacteria bacterium]|nr:MarR family transcriptional regulator [Alphaproteobacteria bacterium]
MERILDLYTKTYKAYALAVMDIEIELHKARTTRINTKLQAYFNSSQNRNTFARIMTKAYIEQEPVTITYICELLNANRSSVSLMVDECEKEGWITIARSSNKAWCMASEELYEDTMDYVHWKKIINKSVVGDHWKSLTQLESVLNKAGVPLPNQSYSEKLDDNANVLELVKNEK